MYDNEYFTKEKHKIEPQRLTNPMLFANNASKAVCMISFSNCLMWQVKS